METASVLQTVFALILVISLFGLSSILYKKYVLDKNLLKGGKARRLVVEEQLYLDSKRRLVLVKKDNTEILLLLGQNGEMVINTQNLEHSDAELPETNAAKRPLRLKNAFSRKKS